MKIRSLCALTLVAITVMIAGNANAHHTLTAEVIEEILEQPEMLDNSELSLNPAEQAEQIEAMIEEVFEPMEEVVPGIVDKMNDIAECESNKLQLDVNGRLIRGQTSDSGIFQVLLVTHRPDYQRIRLDPQNAPDNVVFARFLVERKVKQGRRNVYEDWVCA